MKIPERIVDGLIREVVSFDDPVRLCPRKRHYRCNISGLAAAVETRSSEQESLCDFCGPRESI